MRVVDAFTDEPDMGNLGFQGVSPHAIASFFSKTTDVICYMVESAGAGVVAIALSHASGRRRR